MDPQRKSWNERQKKLRQALSRSQDHAQAIALFLDQHAMVHAAGMGQAGLWSFADEIWEGLSEEAARVIPRNSEHSIAWIFWHLARIEDVTMNLLVAGWPQLLYQDGWLERTRTTIEHTGNAMDGPAVAALSAALDVEALRAYRLAVGRRTREIVGQLRPGELRQKVDPARLQRVWDEGAVVEAAGGIVEYWSKRDVAGLLLMPPTRHNFIHLNEARRIKGKVQRN